MSLLPKALKDLIQHFEDLPGIGPRSAARLAYFFLRAPETRAKSFADTLYSLKQGVRTCESCFNYAEAELCDICSSPDRSDDIILVVEEPLDVVAFERANSFKGKYHVLGGLISPVNGIGPDELRIRELVSRLKNLDTTEVVIATNPNLEGESTALFLKHEISKLGKDLKVTRLARGLPTGADLEYADEVTLQKALEGRIEI